MKDTTVPPSDRSSVVFDAIYAPVLPASPAFAQPALTPIDVTEENLGNLYTSVGITGVTNRALIDSTMGAFMASPGPRTRQDLQVAMGQALNTLEWKVPQFLALMQDEERDPGPMLEGPCPPFVLPGEGCIRVATSGQDGATKSDNRPFVYFWIERDPKSPCLEYEWYQFVRPFIYVNGLERFQGDKFTSSIGGEGVFGE